MCVMYVMYVYICRLKYVLCDVRNIDFDSTALVWGFFTILL
jgi:hypothetical protein